MSIILTSYNSPYFGQTPATATMIVGKNMYRYTGFDYGVFSMIMKENKFKPGKILNWLKKNADFCEKLNTEKGEYYVCKNS